MGTSWNLLIAPTRWHIHHNRRELRSHNYDLLLLVCVLDNIRTSRMVVLNGSMLRRQPVCLHPNALGHSTYLITPYWATYGQRSLTTRCILLVCWLFVHRHLLRLLYDGWNEGFVREAEESTLHPRCQIWSQTKTRRRASLSICYT